MEKRKEKEKGGWIGGKKEEIKGKKRMEEKRKERRRKERRKDI